MTLQIGLLLFPRVQQLDLTGPSEVFASLPDARVHLVARSAEPVATATVLVLTPTATFAGGTPPSWEKGRSSRLAEGTLARAPAEDYRIATQSTSMSNGPGHSGTQTKMRAGGSVGKSRA